MLGNTVVLAFAQMSSLVVSLLLTPFILATLGVEQYGLWAFIGAIVAFATLLQLGVGRGSVRFISFYAERGEIEVVRRIVSYGVLAHFGAGVVLTPVAWLASRFVVSLLDMSSDLEDTATVLFPLVLAYFFFAGGMFPLAAVLIGLERMWMTSVVSVVGQLFYAGAVVALLTAGVGLYGLLIAAWLQAVLQGAVHLVIARRLIGRVLGNPFALGRDLVVEMVKFGGWVQVTQAMGLVSRQADAVVIGSWLNVTSVAYYDIGTRVAQLVRTLPLTLLGPLLPTASGIHAQGDEKRLARTVVQANRLIGLVAFGMAGFILATTPLIIIAWLGREYPHVVWVTGLMVVAQTVLCITGVATTIVVAIGQPRLESAYATLSVLLNIAATLALAPFLGLYGVVGGTVFGIVAASTHFLWRFHRLMRLSLWRQTGAWLWRLAAAAGAAGVVVFLSRSMLISEPESGRSGAALALLALALLYGVVLLVCLRALRFFEERDLATLQRVLPHRLQPIAGLDAVRFIFGART